MRAAKLLFYAKLAEKALQIYERDGWGEFPTVINPDRREIRPTADRGPILLCVDTSGSMRGPREVVAKALALECMRAAREQERGCFVFAFSGPMEVPVRSRHADHCRNSSFSFYGELDNRLLLCLDLMEFLACCCAD